jgi:hypothetical protein
LKIDNLKDLGKLYGVADVDKPQSTSKKQSHKKSPGHNKGNTKQSKAKHVPTGRNAKSQQTEFNNKGGLILQRSVAVSCWHVKGTISRASKRDDLLPVLKRAEENDGTYGRDIANHLLGEEIGREVIGIRLLAICESLNLLESRGDKKRPRYYITENGEKALASGEIMVPEDGTWKVWASNDPLLDFPILKIEPFQEETAYGEVQGRNKDEVKNRIKRFEVAPAWLRKVNGIVSLPSADGSTAICIEKIESKIESVESNANLTISWQPIKRSLSLTGTIANLNINATPTAPHVDFDSVWQELLENEFLWDDWDLEKNRLHVRFSDTLEQERSSKQRRLELKKPHFQKYGSFETSHRVTDIFPKSQEDAQSWAVWSLLNQVSKYATENEYGSWYINAKKPFENYSEGINLPERRELASRAWAQRSKNNHISKIWHLIAAEDWGI